MTRYLPPRLEAPRIEHRRIPSGIAGTRQTAAHVGRLIREGARDFYVRQKAIDVLLERSVAPKDYVGEIDALFRWVQRHVRYTKDPFHVEVLHAARRMLELRAGDCDDITILLGALVKSVGHPVRLVLTGPNARRPDLFSHIYLEAQCQGDWIPLDATMPFGMGWSPRAPVRLVLAIEEEANDDHATTRHAATSPAATARSAGTAAARAIDTAAGARARVAPHAAPRDPPGGRPGARSARQGALDPAAPPAAPRAERVDAKDAAPHLAAGTRHAASPSHHGTNGGAPQGVGSPETEAVRALRQCGRPRSTSGAAAAAALSGGAQTGGDRAAAPAGAGVPARALVPASAFVPAGAIVPARAFVPAGAAVSPSAPSDHAKARALGRAVGDASALYRRFARLPARSLQRVSHDRLIPPVVVELGQLMAVVYRSNKWVGHPRTYIHYMTDPPRLVSDVTGRRLFVVGGSYRVTARGIEG